MQAMRDRNPVANLKKKERLRPWQGVYWQLLQKTWCF
jgi:hypothetical protein